MEVFRKSELVCSELSKSRVTYSGVPLSTGSLSEVSVVHGPLWSEVYQVGNSRNKPFVSFKRRAVLRCVMKSRTLPIHPFVQCLPRCISSPPAGPLVAVWVIRLLWYHSAFVQVTLILCDDDPKAQGWCRWQSGHAKKPRSVSFT